MPNLFVELYPYLNLSLYEQKAYFMGKRDFMSKAFSTEKLFSPFYRMSYK